MKRFSIVAAVILGLSVSACAAGFGSFKNPADKAAIDRIGVTYRATLDAAVTYRDLCDRKIIVRATCAPIVAKLDSANQKVLKAYRILRVFAKEHPTIDAISLVTSLKDAIADFTSIADQNGVK